MIEGRKDWDAMFIFEDGVGSAACDVYALAGVNATGELIPCSAELHGFRRFVEGLHQMRGELRFQGVESSIATGMLFMFRFGGMALFAEKLQVVKLVVTTLGQG